METDDITQLFSTAQEGNNHPIHFSSFYKEFSPRRPTQQIRTLYHPQVMEDAETVRRKKVNKLIVEAPNNLDLETYIGNYGVHSKIDRLLFIADHCTSLQIDAYKLAIQELKQNTIDTTRYLSSFKKLIDAQILHGLPPSTPDTQWAEATQKATRLKQEKLDTELKGYKNNLIKESIRMGHNDLGDHYYSCGDLTSALKCFTRTRDYCTTAKHIIDMCLNVIKVSVALGNFSHVQSYVIKAESTPDTGDRAIVQAKLKCSSGLAYLDGAKYKQAARCFLETSFELQNHYNEVISMNDVATYGGLCALATFDRQELKSKVIDNAEFKQYLELEPQIRELIQSFYNSKYAICLDILNKSKNDYLLDIHLHPHVTALYHLIRKKALMQYFSPFLSVDLHKMAASFNTTVSMLEQELARLITENQIQARIDSHNKVLRAKQVDNRSNVFAESVALREQYEQASRNMLLKVNLLKHNFVVGSNMSNSHSKINM